MQAQCRPPEPDQAQAFALAEAPPPGPPPNGHAQPEPSALQHALAYRAAGLSVIPVRLDGTKAPAGRWADYQDRLATEDELRDWFGREDPYGIGTVCGRESGHKELIDFDRWELFDPWCQLVEAQAPGLVARLCRVETPRDPPGYHLRYRCPDVKIPGNTKLAQAPGPPDPDTGKLTRLTLIETRGEGGQGLAPGGNPKAHPSGRPYVHVAGPPLTALPVVTAAERDILLAAARSFDLATAAGTRAKASDSHAGNGRLRPGDDYNARGPCWEDVLTPHGWEPVHHRGEVTYWRRPGKDGPGWSATTGYCKGRDGCDLLAVFSSNADPFEGPTGARPCSCHSKFAAYALLEHGGDFKAATKALAAQGYGEPRRRAGAGGGAAPGGEGFTVGGLVLRPGPAHRTAARLVVPVAVFKDGDQVDSVSLSKAPNGRKGAAQLLAAHFAEPAPTPEEVNRVLSRIIVAAEGALDAAAQADGPKVRDVVRGQVPQAFLFKFRNDRDAWSEAFRCWVSRADFLAFTPDRLLAAAAEAGDAPRLRPALLDAVRCELQVLWPDLMATLPRAHAAALTPETAQAAAAAFREALGRVWNAPCTNERIVPDQGPPIVIGGSLVTRVRDLLADPGAVLDEHNGRPPWVMIHRPYSAWCRPAIDDNGEPVVRLAMRYELGAQVKVQLPGAHDQRSMTTLGKALGLFDRNPNVPVMTSGGEERLAVLSLDLSRELLDNPEAWEEPEADGAPGGAQSQ